MLTFCPSLASVDISVCQSRGEQRVVRHHGGVAGRGHRRGADAVDDVGGAGGLPV
jgi:hypothetical protein